MLEVLIRLFENKPYRKILFYFASIIIGLSLILTSVYASLFFEITRLNSDSVSYINLFFKMMNYLMESPELIIGALTLLLVSFYLYVQDIEIQNKTQKNWIIQTIVFYIFVCIYFLRFNIEWKYLLSPIGMGLIFYCHHHLDNLKKEKDSSNKLLIQALLYVLFFMASLGYGIYSSSIDTDNFLFMLGLLFVNFILNIDFTKVSSKSFVGVLIILIFYFSTGFSLVENHIRKNICKNIKFGAFVVGDEVFYAWNIYQDNNFLWLKSWEQDPIFPNLYKVNVSAISYIDDYSVSGKIVDYKQRFSSCQY